MKSIITLLQAPLRIEAHALKNVRANTTGPEESLGSMGSKQVPVNRSQASAEETHSRPDPFATAGILKTVGARIKRIVAFPLKTQPILFDEELLDFGASSDIQESPKALLTFFRSEVTGAAHGNRWGGTLQHRNKA